MGTEHFYYYFVEWLLIVFVFYFILFVRILIWVFLYFLKAKKDKELTKRNIASVKINSVNFTSKKIKESEKVKVRKKKQKKESNIFELSKCKLNFITIDKYNLQLWLQLEYDQFIIYS